MHNYVYLSAEDNADDQFQHRLAISEKASKLSLSPQSIQIEILVEVIRAPEHSVDETILGVLLRERGISIADGEVGYVLTYYDIKKNGF